MKLALVANIPHQLTAGAVVMTRLSRNPSITNDIFKVAEAILRAIVEATMSESSEVTIRVEHEFSPPGVNYSGMGVLISHGTTKTFLIPGKRDPHLMQRDGPGELFHKILMVVHSARTPGSEEELAESLEALRDLIQRRLDEAECWIGR